MAAQFVTADPYFAARSIGESTKLLPLNGTVTGSAVSATVQPSVAGQCPFTVNATNSGSSLSGTFAAFSCSGVETGSFNVTKQ